MYMPTVTIPAPKIKASLDRLRENVARYVRGKDDIIENVVVALIAGGHVLIEDLPGLGKTTLAYALARSVDGGFSRVQFTSDMLPSDVIGVSVYDPSVKEFIFKKGPIFANIVLADEINRTTPKTQSALLEVMDRGKVSVDGQTYSVGNPFIVFATQNPVDYEGTFPLPDSQLDRFLVRLKMGYPDYAKELEILEAGLLHYDKIEAQPVLSHSEIVQFQGYVPQVFVEPTVLHYILKIVTATRTESEFKCGISTRGSLALKTASQAAALVSGRAFVIPDDVSKMVLPVLAHRLSLRRPTADPMEERHIIEGILKKITDTVPMPV